MKRQWFVLSFVIHSACSTHPKLTEFWRGWSYSVSIHKDDTLPSFTRICRAPPNMTRLLYRWGLGPIVSKKSVKCERLLCVNGSSYFLSTRLVSTMTLIGHSESGGMLSITMNEEFLQDPFMDMIVLVQVKKKSFLFYLRVDLMFQIAYRPSQHAP